MIKFKDFKVKYPMVTKSFEDNRFVNPLEMFEEYYFNQHTIKDYRKEALDACLNNKIDFYSTSNNIFNMQSKWLRVDCPICHKTLIGHQGGGTSGRMCINFHCDCGFNVDVTMPEDGFSVTFSK